MTPSHSSNNLAGSVVHGKGLPCRASLDSSLATLSGISESISDHLLPDVPRYNTLTSLRGYPKRNLATILEERFNTPLLEIQDLHASGYQPSSPRSVSESFSSSMKVHHTPSYRPATRKVPAFVKSIIRRFRSTSRRIQFRKHRISRRLRLSTTSTQVREQVQ